MRWALFTRLGQRFARFRTRRAQLEARQLGAEISTQELVEFLEGDAFPDEARPEFRDRLREDLWELVKRTHGPKSG